MTTNRKKCRVCGKRKMYSQFYKRSSGSKDGHWHECKECAIKRTKVYKYRDCDRCGESYYRSGGEQLCKKCRRATKAPGLKAGYVGDCKVCKFLDDCNYRVKVKRNAAWLPYCFVESQYHAAWIKEYEDEHSRLLPRRP